MKLITDHQGLEPLIKHSHSDEPFCRRFNENAGPISLYLIQLKPYSQITSNTHGPPQQKSVRIIVADDAYDEKYVIKNIPHFKFNYKFGCLGNHTDLLETEKANANPRRTNTKSKPSQTPKYTAIELANNITHSHAGLQLQLLHERLMNSKMWIHSQQHNSYSKDGDTS